MSTYTECLDLALMNAPILKKLINPVLLVLMRFKRKTVNDTDFITVVVLLCTKQFPFSGVSSYQFRVS